MASVGASSPNSRRSCDPRSERTTREGRGRTFRIGGLRVDIATSLRDGKDETLLLFYDAGARRPPLNAAVKLPPRQQRRIAACLVRGDTLGEIAAELSIGLETVRTHVRVIARRFGASTRAELVLRLCDA
ncbi:MAG: helix-turn-helix transcriptional regulator [Myxococcales bacterium]|nr:helix-turn-helix transcriptional regulator [Myxococcales bacterium]